MIDSDVWCAFAETVASAPGRKAFIRGDAVVTFGEWLARAEDFRAQYRERGVGVGDRVLCWTSNDADMAAAIVAAWGEGAIPALIDPASRATQLESAIATATPALVVRAPRSPLPAETGDVPVLVTDEVSSAPSTPDARTARLSTEPASIVFTSGSTGKPKGVVQSHGNLLRGCRAVASYLDVRDDDVLLCPVPWSFDYGYGQLLSTVVLGVTQVIPAAFNPFGICDALERHRPTVLAGLPSLFSYLMGGMSPIRQADLSSVRLITNTGGQIPGPVLAALREAFTSARVVLNYGLTETYRSCYVPDGARWRPGLIGRGIPGADVVVVREDGRVAAIGEEGEIVHRGDYVCLGYWNNPEATAQTVRPDPLATPGNPRPAPAVFTGDYGYRDDDGLIVYRGRRDHILKSMGIRVSPGEVEALLYDSGLVEFAAVFGLPHELLGHEVWAAVTTTTDDDGIRNALARYARQAMTPAMQPRQYLFKASLPRTTTGKIDYPTLIEEAAALRAGEPGQR